MISTAPLTEYQNNLVGAWFDRTPVGVTVQLCVGQKGVVLGWMFKGQRPVKFGSRGYAMLKQRNDADEY
jgi:hypothetical protein